MTSRRHRCLDFLSRLLPAAVLLLLTVALQDGRAQYLDRMTPGGERAGSELIETMYARGLDYLARSQKEDGTFEGMYGQDPAIAGFCLMAVLAHGDDPNVGPYSGMARKCLEVILRCQNAEGYIVAAQGYQSMYSHGFATLALAEAYGMMRDDRIGPALKKAVDLILESQKHNPLKAWRYNPKDADADVSVSGCQMVALVAARNAGIPVPDKALEDGLRYIASCRNDQGGYGYTSPNETRVTMSSLGSLTLSLTRNKDDASFPKTLAYLTKQLNYRDEHYPFYLEYYMSQALFHADLDVWHQWNLKNIRYMRTIQAADGSWIFNASPAYTTSLALLSLALNYRFLPIYEK